MELQCIFGRSDSPADGGVFAVIYEEDGPNAWVELINRLTDVSYLHDFFEERTHLPPLKGRGSKGLEKAVALARAEVFDLVNFIKQLALHQPGDEDYESLGRIFQPLDNWVVRATDIDLLREKARGRQHNKLLRVYAIRVQPNLYIITGGALKLVHRMGDDVATRVELEKLNTVETWLRDDLGIIDTESFEGL